MSKKTILAIQGSFRKDSISGKLVNGFKDFAPEEVVFRTADISQFPLYNQDLELPEPAFLLDFKAQIKGADGILFVTPEHNRSIPAVLKNALDWASRPLTAYPQRAWHGKPAAVAGYSAYTLGGFGAVHHLRQVLSFLNMPTMQQPEFYLAFGGQKFDEKGKLVDTDTIKHVEQFWAAFLTFMNKFPSQA